MCVINGPIRCCSEVKGFSASHHTILRSLCASVRGQSWINHEGIKINKFLRKTPIREQSTALNPSLQLKGGNKGSL